MGFSYFLWRDFPHARFIERSGGGLLMRRVQLALIEREDFDILYERAEAESSLIGRVFWWTPRAVLICEFLDLRSRIFALELQYKFVC